MEASELKDNYLAAFPDWEKTALLKDPFWLRDTREKSLGYFGEAGFPDTGDEAWKYTPLDAFYRIPFALTADRQSKDAVGAELESLGFRPGDSHVMVFVNGHYSKDLSLPGTTPSGIKMKSLIECLSDGPLKRYFSHILPFENRPFVALNYAYFTDGLFLHVPQGKNLEKPLHLVYLSSNSGKPTQSHIRNLILMEEGSRAAVIEHYWGNNLQPYFTNAVTKVSLDKGAFLDHTKIQQESELAYHLGVLAAQQEAGSRFESRTFSLGASLGRSEVESVLAGKGAECLLDGLSLAAGRQVQDLHTFVDHFSPGCSSRQDFKAVADRKGTSIFDGGILVREGAQKTDARQSNRNLELSHEARIFSKPRLQIYADDVKCSHGSATGQLDEEALFYFQSRGIGREEARRALVYAFAAEKTAQVGLPYLAGPLAGMVRRWMEEELEKKP
jgi:Fe-S cluster assembly protein SufD